MKKDIHPEYRPVVFLDTSSDYKFITRSAVNTQDTIEVDGTTYPLVKVEVSSDSHPFYTGGKGVAKKTGRVERFNRRYANRVKKG